MKSPLLAELVPTPQQCRWAAGAFRMGRSVGLWQPVGASEADVRSARLLAGTLRAATGVVPRLRPTTRYVNHHVLFVGADDGFDVPLDFIPPHPEGYGLRIERGGILLAGADAAGLFYAVQTLVQILRLRRTAGHARPTGPTAGSARPTGLTAGPAVPAADIRDWPAMRWRAAMIDIARQVERADWMEEIVRRLAACKKNMFVLYFEDKFRWKKHALLSHPFGYTAQEFRHLAQVAEENHMEFVPALASLGHCEGILRHEEIAHLREEGAIYQLTLRNAGTRRLLEDLYAEILPLYRGRFFHVNCDESPLLAGPAGSPRSYLRQSVRLFGEHLMFLHDLLARHGKEMMIWGDMLLHHPEIMDCLSRDIIVVDWDYGSMVNRRREGPGLFRRNGFRVMVAPATQRSAEVCFPQSYMMTENIPYFLRHGQEAGAIGEMTTAWEMFSTSTIVGWPGFAASAQYAWNPGATAPARIPAVVAANAHGPEAAADVVRAYRHLSSHLFLDRYFAEARNPATRKFRTYHLDSHEFMATDPMVFLTYRDTPWAQSVVEQASKGVADIERALEKARWGKMDLVVCGWAGAMQAFQGLRRVAVNQAGNLAVQAERLRRKGGLAEAAHCLRDAAERLSTLADAADGLMTPTRKIWEITRHGDDPALEEAFLRRIRLTRDSARAHAARLNAAVAALSRGRDVSLADIVGKQAVLVIKEVNPSSHLVELFKAQVSVSIDGRRWQLVCHKNWFTLEGQTYIAATIPWPPSPSGRPADARGPVRAEAPKRVRLGITRTHIDPRGNPLAGRISVLGGRTLTPGDILDGPPKADIDTADWRIVLTPEVKYRLARKEQWLLEFERVE